MIKSNAATRNLSFSESALAEHYRWWLKLERRRNPLNIQILEFFGVDDAELTVREFQVPVYELPNLHRGIRRALGDWQLAFESGEASDYSRVLWTPRRRRMPVRPGKSSTFVTDGSQFFQLADGSKRVVLFEQTYDPPRVECAVLAPKSARQQLRRELRLLRRWMKRRNPLRGKALRADATFLDNRRPVRWEQIALSAETRQKIWDNTIGILQRRELYVANEVPQRRGVLLYGPPGTGKTMIGKALAAEKLATFIWVTAGDMGSLEATRRVFRLARDLRPAIVFLEDLDLYASDRGAGASMALGELLSQLDGLEKNDGIIVVATTNDLAAIEPALSERPSRFDLVLEIGLPDLAARRQILQENLRRQSPDDALLEMGAKATLGLSGAQVREVAVLTIQTAISRGAVNTECVATPAACDLEIAVAQVTGKKKKQPLGFHTA